MPGDGIRPELHAAEIFGGELFVEAFRVQPGERFAIACDAQREVNVLRIVRPAGALQRAHADDDVKVLVGLAKTKPQPRKIERRPRDFFELEHSGIEIARALEIVDANEYVMEVGFHAK